MVLDLTVLVSGFGVGLFIGIVTDLINKVWLFFASLASNR